MNYGVGDEFGRFEWDVSCDEAIAAAHHIVDAFSSMDTSRRKWLRVRVGAERPPNRNPAHFPLHLPHDVDKLCH